MCWAIHAALVNSVKGFETLRFAPALLHTSISCERTDVLKYIDIVCMYDVVVPHNDFMHSGSHCYCMCFGNGSAVIVAKTNC